MKAKAAPLTLDAIRQHNTTIRMACALATFLKARPRAEAETIFAAFADETIQVKAIQSALEPRGWKGSMQILNRHRREGRCNTCQTWLGWKGLRGGAQS